MKQVSVIRLAALLVAQAMSGRVLQAIQFKQPTIAGRLMTGVLNDAKA